MQTAFDCILQCNIKYLYGKIQFAKLSSLQQPAVSQNATDCSFDNKSPFVLHASSLFLSRSLALCPGVLQHVPGSFLCDAHSNTQWSLINKLKVTKRPSYKLHDCFATRSPSAASKVHNEGRTTTGGVQSVFVCVYILCKERNNNIAGA